MRFVRPFWVALRAAAIAAAVFWATILIIETSGSEIPIGVVQPLVVFILFFFGALLMRRH